MENSVHRPDYRVHIALIFVQVAFGGMHVFGKYALGYIPPMALAGYRVLAAAPILFLLSLRFTRVKPSGKDFAYLAMLGFFGVFANQLLFINGLHFTTAINAGIIMPSVPVFAAAVAVLFGIEKLNAPRAFGIALAVGGALVMLDITRASFSHDTLVGNLMILLNCLSYALYLVFQRPLLKRLHPMTVVAWAFVFGGTGVVAASIPTMIHMSYSTVPPLAWGGLAYIVLVPTALAYALNSWALTRSSAGLVATYITLQPVADAVLATWLLHEGIGVHEVLGFVLIMGGLIVVSRFGPNRRRKAGS
ncbi:MAG: EamA family transporter [Acidobacteriota bacterium]